MFLSNVFTHEDNHINQTNRRLQKDLVKLAAEAEHAVNLWVIEPGKDALRDLEC